MKLLFAGVALLSLGAAAALAQSHQPYSGMQARNIKALSDQQQADLKAGRGMGLALAAELNGYPGPMHVIELSSQLELNAQQLSSMQRLVTEMKTDAIPLGEKLVAQEAELDHLFRNRSVTPERLAAATAAIGATQGALRNAHLKYHLAAAALLSDTQMRRYAELRGYAGGDGARPHHRPRH